MVCRLQVVTFKAGSLQPLRAVCFCSRHKRREQIYFLLGGGPGSCVLVRAGWCALVRVLLVRVLGWCGYLHALNLVSLVRVFLVRAGWCALLVCAGWFVSLVGSCPWLVWLPACLEPRVLGWCVLAGSCPGWCDYLHTLNLVSLVRVPCWFVSLVRALLVRAGSCPGWCGYLHALNLVSLVRVSLVRVLVGVVTYMP